MNNLLDNKKDYLVSKAVCQQVLIVGIKNMLVQAIPFLYQINSLLNVLIFFIVGAIYINAFVYLRFRISKTCAFILFFVILSFVFSLLFFMENGKYIINELPRFLPYCLITFYFVSQVNDISYLEKHMKKYSIVLLFFSFVSALFIYKNGHITSSTWSTYSMPLSYVTMVAVMWLLHSFFKEGKKRWLFLAMAGTAIIIMYGSRNPLLALSSFLIINVFRKINSSFNKKAFVYLFVAIVASVCLVFSRELFSGLNDLLSSLGIYSRTLNYMLESGINTTGRDEIHLALIEALNQKPFFGYGVLGDQLILESTDQSAHSLYLSIFSNYGYIVGSMIITTLVVWNLQVYLKGNLEEKSILLIYMCMVWPRGFTGGDVWSSDVFWWLLGLIVALKVGKERVHLEGNDDEKSFACD